MAKDITGSVLTAPYGVSLETFRNVVSAAFTAYIHYKRLPSVDDITEFANVGKTTVLKVIQTEAFVQAIEDRGVVWRRTSGLTPEQTYTLSVITNPTDKRALGSKLKSCGVSYSKYRAWLKQPLFSKHIQQIAEDMLGDHMGDVHTAFLGQALNGNMKAIQLFYEMTGRHNPAQQQVVDLQRIIGLLLEIITKHVTNTDTLALISGDIEKVLTKNTPKALPGQVISSGPTFEPTFEPTFDIEPSSLDTFEPPVGEVPTFEIG